MELAIIAAIAVVGYLAYSNGSLASVGLPNSSQQTQQQQLQQLQQNQQVLATTPINMSTTSANSQQLAQLGFSGGTKAAAGAASAIAIGANPAIAIATAGVGVVIGIGLVLWQAHKVREKQATNENTAMNTGVAGFDQDLRTINQAFNSGQAVNGQVVDVNVAINAVQQALQQYWLLVSKYIQPGRNGCSNGQNCPQVIAKGNELLAAGKDTCNDYPGQAIGAACCVGCFSLYQTVYGNADGSIPGIIRTLQTGGGTTRVLKVFPSKYGGNTRAEYSLTWHHA